MIQDIRPRIYNNAYADRREPRPNDFVFYTREEKSILVKQEDGAFRFPYVSEVGEEGLYFGFLIDDTAFFVGEEIGDKAPELPGFEFINQMGFRTMKPDWLAFAGVTGMQLVRWLKEERFCGSCGTPLVHSSWERAFICPNCKKTTYPRLMPAVIVGVTHGDKILVTTYADRPSRGMALIAGYSELGEPIEHTVRRELMEEVGIRVKNLRFYKSQPWSFTDTLLMGFYCELDGDDETITLDRNELKSGNWVSREEIPDRRGEVSLTAEMLQRFKEGREYEKAEEVF